MRFSRWCLQTFTITVAGFMLAGLVTGIALAPQLAFFAAGAALIYGKKRGFIGSGWTFGTARLCDLHDLIRAGYFGAKDGLLVGQEKAPRLLNAAKLLWKLPRDMSETACLAFLRAFDRKQVPIRINQGVHTIVIAPAGAGKSTGLIIPFLLTDPNSAVVIDVKGELFRASAAARRAMGHRVVVIDPFKVVTDRPDTFNPLSLIDPGDPSGLDEAKSLSESVVVRTGQETVLHWDDSAEIFVSATAAFVVQAASPEHNNLQTVAMVLSDPAELAGATKAMQASPAWDGMLARMGQNLGHFVEKERGSVLTTTNRHLRFLGTPLVAENTKTSSFDPRLLRSGKMTIYLVLPPDRQRSHAGLMRMWITALQRVVIKGGATEQGRVNFVLDEAASLGSLPAILDSITQLRGYGLRVFLAYQSLGQLKTCFPNDQDQTVLANMDTKIFMGVNDLKTAEYVSGLIGETTVENWSANGGSSSQSSTDGQGHPTSSRSGSAGYSVSDVGRKLLKPEEILALDPRIAIVLARGIPPLLTCFLRHYEKGFKRAAAPLGRYARFVLKVRAVTLAAMSVAAVALVLLAVDHAHPSHPRSASPPPARIHPAGKEVKR